MFKIVFESLERVSSSLTIPLLVLTLIAASYFLKKSYWQKNALGVSLIALTIFPLAWRCVFPLVSSRYFAILLLPAIFLAASLGDKKFYKKWCCPLLIIIASSVMLIKDFRYTSEDRLYIKIARRVNEDIESGQKSVFITTSSDYNKYVYVFQGTDIDIIDFSLLNADTYNAMLNHQLPLNYDKIYIAEKKPINSDDLCRTDRIVLGKYPVGRKKNRQILLTSYLGNKFNIRRTIREKLLLLPHELSDDLMPAGQRDKKKDRLVKQGFSQFSAEAIEFPKNWTPEIYSGSHLKEQVFFSVIESGRILIKAPQNVGMVMLQRKTLPEDYYFIADVNAITDAKIQLSTHNYSLSTKEYLGASNHGFQKLAAGTKSQLVIFQLKSDDFKSQNFNLSLVVTNGEVEINQLYFFPCKILSL